MAGGRLWTVEEDAAIRDLPPGGLRDLARRVGRTPRAVQVRRVVLGYSKPTPRWRPGDRARLAAMVREGASVQEAAAALGRSRDGAYGRRWRSREKHEDVPVARVGAREYAPRC